MWCVILVAKSKVMLVGKKRRQRRESSEIGHTALHKKERACSENSSEREKIILIMLWTEKNSGAYHGQGHNYGDKNIMVLVLLPEFI